MLAGDVGGDAPGLVEGEQLWRRAPSRLPLEIDVGEHLPAGVLHDEVRFVMFLDHSRPNFSLGTRLTG